MTDNRLEIQNEGSTATHQSRRDAAMDKDIGSERKVQSVVIMIFSLLLIVATFLPIVRTTIDVNGREYTARLNGIDCLKVVYFSASYFDQWEILSTDEYKNLEYYGYPDNITNSRINEEIAKDLIYVSLMEFGGTLRLSILAMALSVVVNLVICIVLLANSIKSLINELFTKSDTKKKNSTAYDKMLCGILAYALALPLYAYILVQGCYFGAGCIGIDTVSGGLSYGFILVALCAIGGAIVVLYDWIKRCRSIKGAVLKHKPQAISLIFVVLLLISLVMPVMTADVSISATGYYSTRGFYIHASDITCIHYDDVQYYLDMDNLAWSNNLNIYREGAERNLLYGMIINMGYTNPNGISFVFYLFRALCLGMLALAIFRLLKTIFSIGEIKSAKTPIIMIILSVVVQCISILVLVVIGNNASTSSGDITAVFSYGLGPALGLIAAIGMLSGVGRDAIESDKVVDVSYDNPDVSYAPYVVGFNNK